MSSQPTDLDAALERLYAAPYEAFTETRDALAKELKSAGNAELSAQIKKERRPTVTVWALNQLARRNPEAVKELLESGERLREAQERAVRGEGGEAMRDAGAEQRHVLGGVLKEAMAIIREAGSAGSTDQQDRMEGTLLACANGPEALARQLSEAKLEKDLPRPGFGDLGAAPPRAVREVPAPAPEKAMTPAGEQREQERKQRELDRMREHAEVRARDAARALADAKRRRERAQESAQAAAAALEAATAAAQRAREALADSEGELAKAEEEARAADQALALLR